MINLLAQEFWKEKDSYRRLQNAFYEYVTTRGFDLERGLPKEEIINQLYNDNRLLHQELTKQSKIVEKAEKYEKERSSIISDNTLLHNQVDIMKKEYKEKNLI